ncbi:hypothetical protein [Halosimplex sp. TS25]|uniref:hypothetical protein n=1 Tax=Halosimplex rarum TaxID=3396619 RepID=UPI0039ECF6FE
MDVPWWTWLGFSACFLAIAWGQAYVGNSLLSVGFVVVALLHAGRAVWERMGETVLGGEDRYQTE